jgi:hypothetical protein
MLLFILCALASLHTTLAVAAPPALNVLRTKPTPGGFTAASRGLFFNDSEEIACVAVSRSES